MALVDLLARELVVILTTVVSRGYDPHFGEQGVEEEEVLFERGRHGARVMFGAKGKLGEPRQIGALPLSCILFY